MSENEANDVAPERHLFRQSMWDSVEEQLAAASREERVERLHARPTKPSALRTGAQMTASLLEAQRQMAAATEQLAAMHAGLARRADELHASIAALEARKLALRQQNGGDKVKDRLKLNVGGEHVNTKRSILCAAFPDSWLDALFSGRWENKLLRDPKDPKRIFLDLNPEIFRELVKFCMDSQEPTAGLLELPNVAPELEAELHLTFRLFGLDYLFAQDQVEGTDDESLASDVETDDECAPELSAFFEDAEPEPQPELDSEQSVSNDQVELIVPEGTAVALTARTVDHIVSARYGSLEHKGKWCDVTSVVAKMVDSDGGLQMIVNVLTMGVDPNESADDTSLMIRYARCQAWERTPIPSLCGDVQDATIHAWRELRRAIAQHQMRVQQFEEEQVWMQQFFAADPPPAAPELVYIDLLGTKLCTKRETLMLCGESALARQFDPELWAQHVVNADASESDSDEDDADAVLIQQPPYCFRKIVDQLRLLKISPADEPPPPPVVSPHKQDEFEKMLSYYFPGSLEAFIRTQGVLRPLGNTLTPMLSTLQRRKETEVVISEGNHGWQLSAVPVGGVVLLAVTFGPDGDDDQTLGLIPEDAAEDEYAVAQTYGWCIKRNRTDAKLAGARGAVESECAPSTWQLGAQGHGALVTMLYDSRIRRVSFWEGNMVGKPRTVIDKLPAATLVPFIGLYENSATFVEKRVGY